MSIELNEEQKQAMLATEGAILVTAGAGSGKTRLLTQRIAYLMQEKDVDGYNILAITFTNKAAREMKERVENIVGGLSRIWVSTIHSMCATMLRRDIEKLNPHFNSNFTIYGPDDTAKILKMAITGKQAGKGKLNAKELATVGENSVKEDKNESSEEQAEKDDGFIKQVIYHMSVIKNANIPYDEYEKENSFIKDIDKIILAIKKYQQILEESNALDYDDLLVFTENLLKKVDSVRDYYADRFRYILVDEFQDTNVVQYNIIKLLSSKNKNIFVVGDEDQCIYGWRGANIKNIQNFMKDYENFQLFKLEQNYRSTKNILDLANKLISQNTDRIPKVLKSNKDLGSSVIYRNFATDKQEAEYVAQTIYSLHQVGVGYKDIAVLMRLNSLSRLFEEKFLSYNIPHAVFGGFKFFDRLEVKNAVSYLRVIANPNDISSFNRIINYPKRGIGEATVDKIIDACSFYNLNIIEMCENADLIGTINNGMRQKLKDFYAIIKDIKEYESENGVSEGIRFLITRTGIKVLYSDKSEESRNRRMNLDSLIQSAQDFEENAENATLTSYLENITLVNEAVTGEDDDKVTIASVHGVKGLEYKVVFIIGAEQKVFPIMRDGILDEEERRLMYVAITRAKEQLYITSSTTRFLYGHYEYMTPSMFLKEMGFITEKSYEAIDSAVKENTYGVKNAYDDNIKDYREDKPTYGVRKGVSQSLSDFNKRTKTYQSSNNNSSFGKYKEGFDVGKKVNHSHYGIGKIVAVSGKGDATMVTVQFDVVGKKELLLAFAPLTLVE